MRQGSPRRGHIPGPYKHLQCECKDQMHSDSAGHMPCLLGGAMGAAANDVSHTAL